MRFVRLSYEIKSAHLPRSTFPDVLIVIVVAVVTSLCAAEAIVVVTDDGTI